MVFCGASHSLASAGLQLPPSAQHSTQLWHQVILSNSNRGGMIDDGELLTTPWIYHPTPPLQLSHKSHPITYVHLRCWGFLWGGLNEHWAAVSCLFPICLNFQLSMSLSVLFVYLLLFCLCQTESGEQIVFKKPESLIVIVTVIVCKHRSPQLNSSPSSW